MSTSKSKPKVASADGSTSLVPVTIDGRTVECSSSDTIIEVATSLGLDIPTMCYLPELPPQNSCFLCVVEIEGKSELSPACSTRVTDGMVIQTESARVATARKTGLELLLSDHAGSCVGTCTTACPADLEISSFLDQVELGNHREALKIVRKALPLPAILGHVCAGHCESACLRKDVDQAVSVQSLHGWLAEQDMASESPYIPACKPSTGKRVAIAGAGPAGLSAAYTLLQEGHACTLFDAANRPGGLLLHDMPDVMLEASLVEAEVDIILKMGAEFRGEWQLGTDASLGDLVESHDAVILCLGTTPFVNDLDVKSTSKGITINRSSGATSLAGVYAAGEIVTGKSTVIRAVASGRRAAEGVGAMLANTKGETPKPWFFRSKMTDHERTELLNRRPQDESRRSMSLGVIQDVPSVDQAQGEAAHCLGCACVSLHNCKLRDYSVRYDASPNRYPGATRRELTPDRSHPLVDYEPGKCILCGLCVAVAEEAGEPIGLAFAGRGFETRVVAPFDQGIRGAIDSSARRCAEVCPSGAITLKLGS